MEAVGSSRANGEKNGREELHESILGEVGVSGSHCKGLSGVASFGGGDFAAMLRLQVVNAR